MQGWIHVEWRASVRPDDTALVGPQAEGVRA